MEAKTIAKWIDIDMAQLELGKLIEHFIYTKKAEGRSAKTISWYREQLYHFAGYLESRGLRNVLEDLSVDIVRVDLNPENSSTMK